MVFGISKAGRLVHFYLVYGVPGGHGCKWKAAATNTIINSIREDAATRPPSATYICGDINADIDDISAIKSLLADEHWFDLGGIADQWGQPTEVPTCITQHAHEPHRRDDIFASPLGMQLVRYFGVAMHDLCPSHATLTMHLDLAAPSYELNQLRTLQPLDALVNDRFVDFYGPPPVKPDYDVCLDREWSHTDPEAAVPTSLLKELLAKDFKAVTDAYSKKHTSYLEAIHIYMDNALCIHLKTFEDLLGRGDTNTFWQDFWFIIENSIAHFTDASQRPDLGRFVGRARNLIRKVTHTPTFGRECSGNVHTTPSPLAQSLAVQVNRCKHLQCCIKVAMKNKASMAKMQLLNEDIKHAKAAIVRFAEWEVKNPKGLIPDDVHTEGPEGSRAADLIEACSHPATSSLKMVFLLEHAIRRYEAIREVLLRKHHAGCRSGSSSVRLSAAESRPSEVAVLPPSFV